VRGHSGVQRKRILPKEELERLHIQEGWSVAKIARHFKSNARLVKRNMIEHGIKQRTYQTPAYKSLANLSDVEVGWLAGIIEGEGCIAPQFRGYWVRMRVLVVNTDMAMLDKLQELAGGTISKKRIKAQPHHRPQRTWYLSANHCVEFLETIYPYLVGRKKDEASVSLRIAETISPLVGRNADGSYHKMDEATLETRKQLLEELKEIKTHHPV